MQYFNDVNSRVLTDNAIDGKLSIGRLFAHFAEVRPDSISMLDDNGAAITWANLNALTNKLARAFAAKGVAHNDTVAIVIPNSVTFFQACIAAWKLGATVLPVSPHLTTNERQRILNLAAPVLVIGVSESISVNGRPVPIHNGDVDDIAYCDDSLPDIAPMYWKALTSGGSTGQPKLIVSHDSPYYDPRVAAVPYMHANGVQLVAGPLYHNAAFIYAFRGLFCGHRLVVMSHFEPARALRLIEQHRVTWTQLVPTMMNRIRRLPAELLEATDVSSIRTLLHVGGPCAPDLKRAFIRWLGGERVIEVYAGTENQGITLINGDDWLNHPGSVGRAIRGSAFRILDEDGEDVKAGEVGEIYFMPAGGPGSTYHYVGATPRSNGGWESLGDLGRVDQDGFLYLTDRAADCIISGGANVYPAEVEAVLESLPSVNSAAVIGLPDDDLGHRVVALVEPVPGITLTIDELDERVRSKLSGPRIPRAYELVSHPLRDEAGKVRRSALREARLPGGPNVDSSLHPNAGRWRDLRTGASTVDAVLGVLDLDLDGDHCFTASSLTNPPDRIFGGQVLAQAAVAAARTVAKYPSGAAFMLHSLHGHFLRTGRPRVPLRLEVAHLHNGRRFRVLRVDLRQKGLLIATATASFHVPEDGHFSHQIDQPHTTGPNELQSRFPFPIDQTIVPAGPFELRELPPKAGTAEEPADVWVRVPAALPDDPLLHQALIVYLSDYSIVRQAFHLHGLHRENTKAASLDHAIWLHRSTRADRWLHYRTNSPNAEGHRAFGTGSIFAADGRLIASTAQEMLVRPRELETQDRPCASPATKHRRRQEPA